jgi:hypothetical protein
MEEEVLDSLETEVKEDKDMVKIKRESKTEV